MTTSPTHHPSATRTRARPRAASRRAGYVVAVGVSALLLYLLNRSPGWQAVPFLTDAMNRVIGVVNLSITAGLVANLVYVVWDPTWLKALGDLATTCAGVLAMLRIWQVWPFDFPAGSPWNLVAHVALGLGLVGGAIGIVESTVRYVRAIGFSSA
jgi:hypothetical protein